MHDPHRSPLDQIPHRSAIRLNRRRLLEATAGAAALTAIEGSRAIAQSTPDAADGPVLPLYPHGQEITLDPHRAINWGPHWVLLPYVWAGLLGFDENGRVVPVLAASVEPEDGGRVWVASIRPEATFASGNPVTADALINGWLRALRPQRPAPMAQYMRRVDGFEAFTAGESDEIGFEARDEHTVAITLAEPYALFREDLATFVWAAVDTATLDGVPDSQAPFADASAGRWRFMPPDGGDIVMTLREDASTTPTGFTQVSWRSFEGPLAAEDAYAALLDETLALADAPGPVREIANEQDGSSVELVDPAGSTMLLGMDFRQPPFDDPRVRRAVAHAIDTDQWASEIMGGDFTAASSITPPAIALNAGYAPPEPLPFDPDTARALLQEAGLNGDEMPTVVIWQPADATEAEVEALDRLLAMIEENSGLVIDADRSLTTAQIDARRADEQGLQIATRWWWPMLNSPSGLADIGLPDSAAMGEWFNWSEDLENAEAAEAAANFIAAIASARTELDQPARLQHFADAERLLIETAVYIPLGHGVQAFVRGDRLTGTRHGAFTGYMPAAFDEAVTWSGDDAS